MLYLMLAISLLFSLPAMLVGIGFAGGLEGFSLPARDILSIVVWALSGVVIFGPIIGVGFFGIRLLAEKKF